MPEPVVTRETPSADPPLVERLQARVAELEEILDALRYGRVDALVVQTPEGDRVFTLQDAGLPYRQLVEAMDEGAATLARDGSVLYCNRRFAEMAACRMERIIGTSIRRFVAPADRRRVGALLRGGRRRGQREVRLGSLQAGWHWVTLSISPIEVAGQGALCLVATDVTALRRTEGALRHLNDTLEQKVRERTAEAEARTAELKLVEVALEEYVARLEAVNREQEAFSYTISHDLRAPLRAIDGFSSFLEDEAADRLEPTHRRWLHQIRHNAVRMGALIDDLLQFSRMGRADLKCETVDVGSLVAEVWADCMAVAGEQRVELTVGNLPTVRGDAVLLRQVFANLLANAVKFTRYREVGVVEVGVDRRETEFLFFVRDNGAGFDMQYVGKLFGVFQRLHRQDDFEGTGAGLAIVRRIVERHGGLVHAEGEIDRGATFSFTLPIR